MLEYIYFVKRPGCEDEHFDFFKQAESFALGCLTEKPIITQIEVQRNDFGECIDSCDLGTIWSWEDLMSKPDPETEETLFSKNETFGISKDLPDTVPSDLGQLLRDKEAKFSAQTSEDRAADVRQLAVNKLNFLNTVQPANKAEANVLNQGKALMQRIIDAPLLTNRECDDFLIQFYDFEEFFNSIDALSSVDQFVVSDSSEVNLSEPEDVANTEQAANSLVNPSESESTPTVEELVEMMEENEDTVECKWCNELFDKSECRKEVDLGWLCSRCEAAIKSRGETLTFIEGDLEFLDESTFAEVDEELTEASLSDIADAANSEFNSDWNSRDILDMTGIDDEINNITNTYRDMTPSEKAAYERECEREKAYRQKLSAWKSYKRSKSKTEDLHDLGNEYDGAYPDYKPELSKVDETPEVSDSHLRLCPECGKDTFDHETGICVNCGFNILSEALDQKDITTITTTVDKAIEPLEKTLVTKVDDLHKKLESEVDYLAKAVQNGSDYIFKQTSAMDEQNFKRAEHVIKAVERENDYTLASLKTLAKNDQIIYNALK